MIVRTALGALTAVAVLAAVAAALPERPVQKQVDKAAPFGTLVTPPPPDADVQASLLKLASLPSTADTKTPTAQAAPIAADTQPSTPTNPGEPSVSVMPDTSASKAEPTAPAAAEVPEAQAYAAEPPRAVSAIPPAVKAPDGAAKTTGTININTASIETLDRLPGAGRIGRAIARRRPYRSVEDLVAKRVLRDVAFRRIKPLISAE